MWTAPFRFSRRSRTTKSRTSHSPRSFFALSARRCGWLRSLVRRGRTMDVGAGGRGAEVNPFTEDLVRREVSRLLRGPYRGRFLCFSCLGAFVRDAVGASRTKGQIERALLSVTKSPGALVNKRSLICDQC